MSDMVSWAEEELERYGHTFYGEAMNRDVLEVIKVLSNQGHTNSSAQVVIALVKRLWSWKPLTPLTGEDNEWNEISTEGLMQNRRYSSVFKNRKTGIAYDIGGRYFQEPDEDISFSCKESHVDIEFPYMPKDKVPVYKLKYKSDEVPIKEALEKGLYEIL